MLRGMNTQHLAGQVAQNTQDIKDMKTSTQRQEVVAMVTEIITVQYSNARAYANVVIVAGYAAFFTMLGFARGDIPHDATIWAMLLMTFSATVFVLFEVFKMFWLSWGVRRHIFALDDPLRRPHPPPGPARGHGTGDAHARQDLCWSWC